VIARYDKALHASSHMRVRITFRCKSVVRKPIKQHLYRSVVHSPQSVHVGGVGIVEGVGGFESTPSSCLQTLIFEWKSFKFQPLGEFQTFRHL